MAPPTRTATTSLALKHKLEVVRAAVLACHSAGSLLAEEGDRATARLLRSAEATSRAAAGRLQATLGAAGKPPGQRTVSPEEGPADQLDPKADKAKEKKAAARAKKKKAKKKAAQEAQAEGGVVGMEGGDLVDGSPSLLALTASCEPGGSLLVGDLTELGITSSTLAVPATSSPPVHAVVGNDESQRVGAGPRAIATAAVERRSGEDGASFVRRLSLAAGPEAQALAATLFGHLGIPEVVQSHGSPGKGMKGPEAVQSHGSPGRGRGKMGKQGKDMGF